MIIGMIFLPMAANVVKAAPSTAFVWSNTRYDWGDDKYHVDAGIQFAGFEGMAMGFEPNDQGTWEWDYGFGSPDIETYAFDSSGTADNTPSPWPSYPSAGTYTATLTVSDQSGNSDYDTISVVVHSTPTATLTLDKTTVDMGETITYTISNLQGGAVKPGNSMQYNYHFGDTTSGWTTSQSIQHSYSSSGNYDVVVHMYDDAIPNQSTAYTPTTNTVQVTVNDATPITTEPSEPQNLVASSTMGQVALSWNAPASNGGTSITGYNIYRGTSSSNIPLFDTVGNQLSYLDTSVIDGTTYYYQVSAENSVGEGPKTTPYVDATPPSALVPSEPRNLIATSGTSQISLSWNTPLLDGGSSITGYNIYRGTSSSNIPFYDSIGNQVSYVDSSVSEGTTYYYQVSADNSVGEGAKSNQDSATIDSSEPDQEQEPDQSSDVKITSARPHITHMTISCQPRQFLVDITNTGTDIAENVYASITPPIGVSVDRARVSYGDIGPGETKSGLETYMISVNTNANYLEFIVNVEWTDDYGTHTTNLPIIIGNPGPDYSSDFDSLLAEVIFEMLLPEDTPGIPFPFGWLLEQTSGGLINRAIIIAVYDQNGLPVDGAILSLQSEYPSGPETRDGIYLWTNELSPGTDASIPDELWIKVYNPTTNEYETKGYVNIGSVPPNIGGDGVPIFRVQINIEDHSQPSNEIRIEAFCPVNIIITDQLGRKIGYDTSTDSEINEIPNAYYSGPDFHPEVIYIPDATESYTLSIDGVGDGDYHILVQKTNNDYVSEYWINGTIAEGEQVNETLSMESTSLTWNNQWLIGMIIGIVVCAIVVVIWKRR